MQIGPDSESGSAGFDPFVNVSTEAGIGALVLSTPFAAMTFTASELDVGVSSENLAELLRADVTVDEIEAHVVKNSVMRSDFTRSTKIRNIPRIQLTILLVVIAIVSFVSGIFRGLNGTVPVWVFVAAVGFILGVVVVSGVITPVVRAFRDL